MVIYNMESSAAEKDLELKDAGNSSGKTEMLRQKGLSSFLERQGEAWGGKAEWLYSLVGDGETLPRQHR